MVWFKVDDGLPTHRKVLSIPRGQRRLAAVGAWTLAGAWCSANLTEGLVPGSVLDDLGIPARVAADLVAAGLWMQEPDAYRMHDFLDRNPSAEQVRADRAAAAERQRRAREKSKTSRPASRRDSRRDSAVTDEARHGVTHGDSHAPVTPVVTVPPTRPDPEEQPPTTSVARVDDPTPGPQAVVAAYVDACQEVAGLLDPRAKGRIAKDAAVLLRSGAPMPLLLEAARQLAVNGYADLGAEARRLHAQRNPRSRPSTTDQRVTQGLSLVEHFRQQEGA